MVSGIEAFISFLQGFVFLILLKIYSDDALNTVRYRLTPGFNTIVKPFKTIEQGRNLVFSESAAAKKKNTKKEKVTKNATTTKKVSKASAKETAKTAKPAKVAKKTPVKSTKVSKTVNPALKTKKLQDFRGTVGEIKKVDGGIIYIGGLYNLSIGEIVYFGKNLEKAITLNLENNVAKAATFLTNDEISQGTPVFRSFRLMQIPISPKLLGNVIDCLGNNLTGQSPSVKTHTVSRNVDVKALGVIHRKTINEPLVTGVLSIDSMLPIGRGQRELIIGDRQLGKTSLAVDSIMSQKGLHLSS